MIGPTVERFGRVPSTRRRRKAAAGYASAQRVGSWSWGLLCFATVGSALGLGALHMPTLFVVAVAAFSAAALAMHGRRLSSIPRPVWILFALAGYTAFQALPLPSSWLEVLSPNAAYVWQRAFEVAPAGRWMSISLDRGATLVEVLKWATYGAAFIAAASYGAARNMVRGLSLPLASTVAVAFVTLAHGLVGATAIYGFYQPFSSHSIWHLGPLLNPNHLASYLNFGIFCGLGLLVARRQVVPVWTLGLAVAFLIPNAIVAGSRGGILGLLVGLAVFFVTLPRRRYADADFGPLPKLTVLATFATVFLVAAGFTVLLASDRTARELYEVNVDKLRLLTWSAKLIGDYPWLGVGRGSFESVFTAYRAGTSNEIYSHPENLPVQWLGEWGVPVGVGGLAALIWAFRPRRLGARWSAPASGAAAGTAAIFVQNFVDFGLEVPAISLVVIVALGVCWGHANARHNEGVEVSPSVRHVASIALVSVGAVLSLVVLIAGFRPLIYDRQALSQAYDAIDVKTRAGLADVRAAVSSAVLAHPGDPYFYRMGALLAWQAGQDPMPWLQRALDRGPSVGRTHLLVARVVAARRATRQALLELRLAATFDPNLVQPAAQAAVSWTSSFAELSRAVPEGEQGIRMLAVMNRLLAPDSQLREPLLVELVARNPKRKESLSALAAFFVAELEHGEASLRCRGDLAGACQAEADRWLGTLARVAPRDGDGLLLRSRLLRATGNTERALVLLGEQCASLVDGARSKCFLKRLELSGGAHDTQQFASAVKDYLGDSCTDSDGCSTALEKVADLSASRGEWQDALGYYERAARERPDDRVWMKLARASAHVGAFGRVRSALDRVRNHARFGDEYARLSKLANTGQLGQPRQ